MTQKKIEFWGVNFSISPISETTEVFCIFTQKLRMADLFVSNLEITEVSVFFTDGWQHCRIVIMVVDSEMDQGLVVPSW